MSDYDFILNEMKFSFSNVTSFENCKWGWMKTYIDIADREPNFFAEFGSFCHDIMEKLFKGELDLFDLVSYYEEHYYEKVVSPPPPYPDGMAQKYYDDGYNFFLNLEINVDDYEVLETEKGSDSIWNGIKLIIKPDMVLRDKKTNKVILMDYKTSIIHRNGKISKKDNKKLDGYKKQMYLYAFFLSKSPKTKIDEIQLWFIRTNSIETFSYNEKEGTETLDWFMSIVSKIKEEENFEANNSEQYFCNNLCGVRSICPFRIQQHQALEP